MGTVNIVQFAWCITLKLWGLHSKSEAKYSVILVYMTLKLWGYITTLSTSKYINLN